MKKARYFLIFLLLPMLFTNLAFSAAPPTELPNLIGVWKGFTVPVGGTAEVLVKLNLTKVGNVAVPNGFFEGTLAIGADTVSVTAGNDRDFPYKVNINLLNPPSGVSFGMSAKLDWLPGPMILVHGMGFNNTPYKPFILKKTSP
jgi:hypothetical protein